MTRFLAEWYESDGPGGQTEFNPDLVEMGTKAFPTYEDAEKHAIKQAAHGPADDWFAVHEQEWNPHYYAGFDVGRYETVATWICGEECHA